MSFPFSPPFKTRILNATSTTTANTQLTVPVPARGKFFGLVVGYGGAVAQTATGTGNFDVTYCPSGGATAQSTVPSFGQLSVTTSTQGTFIATQLTLTTTAVQYVNAGDMLSVITSTLACPSVSFIIQEF